MGTQSALEFSRELGVDLVKGSSMEADLYGFHQLQRKKHLAFLSACPCVGQGRGKWGLKVVTVKHQKNKVSYFITLCVCVIYMFKIYMFGLEY